MKTMFHSLKFAIFACVLLNAPSGAHYSEDHPNPSPSPLYFAPLRKIFEGSKLQDFVAVDMDGDGDKDIASITRDSIIWCDKGNASYSLFSAFSVVFYESGRTNLNAIHMQV